MRTYIGHQQVVGSEEFEELALGIDRELFLGVEDETGEGRAARQAAARDVLADLVAQGAAGDEVAAWDALYAEALTRTVPLLRSSARSVRVPGAGEAA
ncbi:hypothetical protein ACIGXA_14260 [Streptomyces fildesensis]|uniref:Uncharacterized protein n=1 Tax=Streptomyces fildesensis TaxID=375757 RepID=A0ABW8C5H9_9ACTN